jgi:hypothetical protein
MRTHVEFRSAAFPARSGEEAEINPGFPLWVGCGNYEEYADGFLCFIELRTPVVRKLFRTIDTSARVEEVATALDGILRSHPGVRDVRWWSESEADTSR